MLFVSGCEKGLWQPELCALHLPDRRLQVLLKHHPGVIPFAAGIKPVWGQDSTTVFLTSFPHRDCRLFRLDRTVDTVECILQEGIWRHPGAREDLVFVKDEKTGLTIGYDPPAALVSQQAFAYGRKSGALYVLLGYRIYPGPPGWRIDLDSINAPRWAMQRLQSLLQHSSEESVDLVTLDTAGIPQLIRQQEWTDHRDLAVSPDERFIAYFNSEELRVFDRMEQAILRPTLSEGVLPRDVSFSPDGNTLAVVGIAPHEYAGVFIARAPSFTSLELLGPKRPPSIRNVCWSSDGAWMIVAVAAPREPTISDFVAIEVSSGEEVVVPRPYLVNGKGDARYYVCEGIDWTK